MDNFKITRDGHYDIKENLKLKMGIALRYQAARIDAFFENH